MERFQGEGGRSRKQALIGVGLTGAALTGALSFNSFTDNDAPASADDSGKTLEWLDVAGQNNQSCVEIVNKAGTAETYELEFDDEKLTLVKSDIGVDQPGRLWENSMRAPFESDDPDAEVKAGFCEDAPFSVATAYTLGNVIYKGKRLADTEAGSWLKTYADLKPEELDEKAEHLLGSDLKRTEVEEHLERYNERIKLAENLSAVLTNLQSDGLDTGATDVDVSYADEAFVGVEGIPEMVAKNGQFKDAEALMYSAKLKGEICPTPIIGFNTGLGKDGNPKNGDQRPETFVPDECVPEESTTTTTRRGETTTSTTRRDGTTTTTRPGETTTTTYPDKNPQPPVVGGPSTTVEAPDPGPDYPTTSTTATTVRPGPTTTTTMAGNGTTTTTEAGECGPACD